MKIFFIREKDSQFGGAEKYLSRLKKSLDSIKIDYEVINSPAPKFLPSWIRVLLFNFYLCFIKKDKFYFSLERISCPDIYRAGDGVHKAFLTKVNKSKLNPLHYIYLFYEKKCFENSKIIIANSKMVKEEIVNFYKINPQKIRVVYNGFDGYNSINQGQLNSIREKYNINSKKKIFLFVGSGYMRKGLKEFLRIISEIESKQTMSIVIGYDKNESMYKKIAKNLGIRNILFLGKRPDAKIFYSLSDFFILPTYYDPFSNVILEAMLNRNIVITTKQNGAHEIIDKDFVMQSPDDLKIVNKINELINDKNKLNVIKYNNFNIAKKYSMASNTKQTLKSISEIC